MEVKTDTKERFSVITVNEDALSANMTEELCQHLIKCLNAPPKNLVLKLSKVKTMTEESCEQLVKTQQLFYDSGASFVICELTSELEDFLDEKELLEMMNVTPTESEAWDIVQMEEIERELFDGDEDIV